MLLWQKFVFFLITLMPLLCCAGNSLTRLPSAVIPTDYVLHINTNIHKNITDFRGVVEIDITIKQRTNVIVLHAKLLRGYRITLTNVQTREKIKKLEFRNQEETDQLMIWRPTSPLNLRVGENYKLKIQFVGDIQDSNFGFYRSSFEDDIPIAMTQLEPAKARTVFPCFDEFGFKATFTISITHGSNYTALSNMPAVDSFVSSFDKSMTTTRFQKTPIMSTYLVAFAVTNFNHTAKLINGIEYRIFYHKNSTCIGTEAIENAYKSLQTLENYFGIEYPLPKLDQVWVSSSFGRAMENWGLMLFGSSNTIPDVRSHDIQERIELVNVENHEIAHQWFGNLVTPKWFTCVWLKEGFSTFYSFVTADLVYPGERFFEYYLANDNFLAYNYPVDHALTFKNASLNALDYFDIITYHFGAAFIRMFHHAIGTKTFDKGVSYYLKKFQYSVADEEDLYGSLQVAVNEDRVSLFQYAGSVANVMRTWTRNVGIPIVTIIRNFDTATLTILQESKNDRHDHQYWWIPLSFATASNPNFNQTKADYLMPPQRQVTLDLRDLNISLSNDDWLIVNKQQTGYFHTVYDIRNLKLITKALRTDHEKIHLFDRAKIFADLEALYLKDLVTVEALLEAFSYLKHEKETLPWQYALETINMILSRLTEGKSLELFKKFVHEIFSDLYNRHVEDPLEFLSNDPKIPQKVDHIAYQIELEGCKDLPQNFPHDYYYGKLLDKEPCLSSICEAIRIATVEELKAIIEFVCGEYSDSSSYLNFLSVLKCVKREHYPAVLSFIVQTDIELVGIDQTKIILLLEFLLLDPSNLSLLPLVLTDEETLAMMKVYEKEMERKNFFDRNEERMQAWLENHMRNQRGF